MNYEGLTQACSVLEKIPPDELLIACESDKQREVWGATKAFYSLILWNLNSYRTGEKPPPIDTKSGYGKLIQDWTDFYLSLYDILWRGWRHSETEIVEIAEKHTKSIFSSPGQLLAFFIRLDGESELSYLFASYFEIRFREVGKALKGDRAALEKYKLLLTAPHDQLLLECLKAIEKGAKRDKPLKKKLKEFWAINAKLLGRSAKTCHPRNAPKSIAIRRGQIRNIS